MIPIRCFSCGKPIAQDWDNYEEQTAGGKDAKKVLDDLGHTRYCCRRMFLSHSEVIEESMKHKRF
ncbi:MAG: DNA-directed RNA polymerase subunit N [Candidatus Altiarchaeota archaeon]